MSFEEPAQQTSAPGRRQPGDAADAPTAALPGPLNLAGSAEIESDSTTDVLSLDELFDGQPPPAEPGGADRPSADRPAVDEAPTWTAMPVVPVRSEPVTPAGRTAPSDATASPLSGRVRTDAAAAWEAAVRRTRAWLARDDNGLTLATALVAIVLIIAVTALGR